MASFDSAFLSARKAGKKVFTWEGKSYHTRTKEEEDRDKKTLPKDASVPADNQDLLPEGTVAPAVSPDMLPEVSATTAAAQANVDKANTAPKKAGDDADEEKARRTNSTAKR